MCSKCDNSSPMRIVKRENSTEAFHWVCKRPCTYICSLRQGCVKTLKCDMKPIFKGICNYVNGISFIDIAFVLSISRHTASAICDIVREAIYLHVMEECDRIGGIIEVATL